MKTRFDAFYTDTPPVANSATAAISMRTVVVQPSQRARRPLTCSPMILRSEEMSIVTIRNGLAVTPLMTATRISSLIGSRRAD